MNQKKYFILAVLLSLTLAITACGRGRRDATNGNDYEPTVRTLSILAQDHFSRVIERAKTALIASWQAQFMTCFCWAPNHLISGH